MDLSKDYYTILGVDKDSTKEEIKKRYYILSKSHHPDKGGDPILFKEISESYQVLISDEKRKLYDQKTESFDIINEYQDLFNLKVKPKVKNKKVQEDLNITIYVDINEFDGTIIYPRYVKCKKCDSTGKDLNSKIEVKDSNGRVIRRFEAIDGCDFCEGEGVDENGNKCKVCNGSSTKKCKICDGEGRILGKQKLTNISLKNKQTKINHMGHCSKKESGKVGYLLIIKK